VTPSSDIKAHLNADETLLWEGRPVASRELTSYGGPHETAARILFGLSAVMTLIFFVGSQNGASRGLSLPLVAFVGGPILAGLATRYLGRRRARAQLQRTRYAITSKRFLRVSGSTSESFPISDKIIANVALGTDGTDTLRFEDEGSDALKGTFQDTNVAEPNLKALVLKSGDASLAQAAIRQAQAAL